MKNLLLNDKEDIVLTYQCKISNNFILNQNKYFNVTQELDNFNKISKNSTLWSFGTILYELLVGMVNLGLYCAAVKYHLCFSPSLTVIQKA